jgi:hypothetical protein
MWLIVAVASIISVTIVLSQNAMASAYAGQTGGSTRLGPADLDVDETAEAQNTTTAGATNQTTTNGNMTGTNSTN